MATATMKTTKLTDAQLASARRTVVFLAVGTALGLILTATGADNPIARGAAFGLAWMIAGRA